MQLITRTGKSDPGPQLSQHLDKKGHMTDIRAETTSSLWKQSDRLDSNWKRRESEGGREALLQYRGPQGPVVWAGPFITRQGVHSSTSLCSDTLKTKNMWPSIAGFRHHVVAVGGFCSYRCVCRQVWAGLFCAYSGGSVWVCFQCLIHSSMLTRPQRAQPHTSGGAWVSVCMCEAVKPHLGNPSSRERDAAAERRINVWGEGALCLERCETGRRREAVFTLNVTLVR